MTVLDIQALTALAPPAPPLALPRLHNPDKDEIVRALASAGCAVVEASFCQREFAHIYDGLDHWFDAAPFCEEKFFGLRTKRFSGVFAKAPQTAALALHKPVLAAVEQVLLGGERQFGECVQLNLTQAIEIWPGEHAQLLHRDDNLFPAAKNHELMVNVAWALDPFTADNGATRLLPGSHLWPRQEIEEYADAGVDAVAPAGSAIVWLGSLLHGGGANRSVLPRRALILSYSLAWLAQAEKLLLTIPPDVVRNLPERLQKLIGYQVHRPNLGWIEGRDPIEWLQGETKPLAPARDNLTSAQADLMNAYLKAAGR
ncbi:MAG TPA: phytanoyl-CoA dioxygenase [Hyphomonadaceae bacterium]|nr:phytanoyl-CoA dioxygenase [Hyphomonadaceae bacterium]